MKVTDTEEGRNRRTKKGKTRKRRERDRAKRRGKFNRDKEKRKLIETVEDDWSMKGHSNISAVIYCRTQNVSATQT